MSKASQGPSLIVGVVHVPPPARAHTAVRAAEQAPSGTLQCHLVCRVVVIGACGCARDDETGDVHPSCGRRGTLRACSDLSTKGRTQ